MKFAFMYVSLWLSSSSPSVLSFTMECLTTYELIRTGKDIVVAVQPEQIWMEVEEVVVVVLRFSKSPQ